MAYDQLMHTYMSYGPVNNIPPSPNVAPGVAAFYYTTDTALLYVWSGIGWVPVSGGAGSTSGGAGSTSDVVKIAETVLGVASQNITFNAIPASYRHLKLVMQASGDTAAPFTQCKLQINGDTATNYDWCQIYGQSGTFGATDAMAQSSIQLADISAGTAPTNGASAIVATFPNYKGTTFHKSVVSQNEEARDSSTYFLESTGGRWHSTSAITSLLLFLGAGNFAVGTVATLYGMN